MTGLPERRWPRVVAGYAVFLVLLATAVVPVYLGVEAQKRTLVIRLAGTLVLGVVLIHLATKVRTRIDDQGPSDFERALHPAPLAPTLDPRFVEIREELRYSTGSGRYFDRVLWPQLIAVSNQVPRRPSPSVLVKPAGRFFHRGPALTTLRKLIAAIEETRE
jgi:hypothetical protein